MGPRTQRFLDRLQARELILADGAWATQLQKMGLQTDQCPEEWNVSHPDWIRQLAQDYCDAGAQMILSNTFGANKYRLMRYGLGDRVRELNLRGVEHSLQAAEKSGAFVAASVGPTGEFIEPEGMVREDEMYTSFREQIEAVREAGADAVCLETMYVIEEARIAIRAARDLKMFVIASVTFDSTPDGFRMMLGTGVDAATRALDEAGADVIGTNCGNGIVDMVRIAHRMRLFTKRPMMVKSNAGLPELKDGRLLYHESAEFMAARIEELKRTGVTIIGGCCGTTPTYIREFGAAMDKLRR